MVSGHLQEKKGYYYCVLSFKDNITGKRKTKWISTGLPVKGNKKKAEAILMEERRAFIDTSADKNKVLFSDYLQKYWLPAAKNSIEITTYGGYQSRVNRVIAPFFMEKKIYLEDLSPADIQNFYNLQAERVKANTVKGYHAIIHKSLEHAVKIGKIPFNPSDRTDRPKVVQYIPEYYNGQDIQRLIEATKDEDIGLLIKFTVFYGTRKSESIGLRWSAIDLENELFTIRHIVTSVKIDGKKILVQKDRPKQKASHRTMPLIDNFKELFMELKETQARNKELCKGSYDTRYLDYVFVDSMGTLLKPDYVTQRFEALLKKHGLKKIRFHDLRHSAASLLVQNGVPMKQVQEWLGHSDFATTANIYTHLQTESKVQTAESIKGFLNLGNEDTENSKKEKEAISEDTASSTLDS